MELLTWNLGARWKNGERSFDALEVACQHLKKLRRQRKSFLAAFQECPEDAQAIERMVPGTHVYGNVARVVISSSPLTSQKDLDRFVAVRTIIDGHNLAAISYHGVDRKSHAEPTQRGGRSSELRWLMDNYCGTDSALIMGDFNAQPADPEVQGRWCLSFAPDEGYHRESHSRVRGGFRVIPSSGHPGTYYWKPPDMQDVWQTLDFVVASEHLAANASCKVSLKLAGKVLVDALGRPSVSDHLPILGKVDFAQGAPS
jgi:endonuclease/exonuclease/phosphatase family metal-dependent hydrolase